MPSQILPISHRGLLPTIETAASSILIKTEIDNDDPTASLIVSSKFEDDDDKTVSLNPLLSRASSYTTINPINNYYQQPRRRTASDWSLSSLSGGGSRRQSISKSVGHAAADTFLVTRLSFKLLRYLGYTTFLSVFLFPFNVYFFCQICTVLAITEFYSNH